MKAKKTDKHDPSSVILYAAEQAVKKGKNCFVLACPRSFQWSAVPPSPRFSHWKVDHMGEVYAHMGGPGVTDYTYEKLED